MADNAQPGVQEERLHHEERLHGARSRLPPASCLALRPSSCLWHLCARACAVDSQRGGARASLGRARCASQRLLGGPDALAGAAAARPRAPAPPDASRLTRAGQRERAAPGAALSLEPAAAGRRRPGTLLRRLRPHHRLCAPGPQCNELRSCCLTEGCRFANRPLRMASAKWGAFAHGLGVLQCVKLGREWCRSGRAFCSCRRRAGANAPVAEKSVADCQAHAACRRVMHGRRCVDEQPLARARERCTCSCGLWRVRIRRPARARADWACACRAQSATPSATATSWRRCWGRSCARRRCTATSRSSSARRAAARPSHAVLVYGVLVLHELGSLGGAAIGPAAFARAATQRRSCACRSQRPYCALLWKRCWAG